MAAAACAGMGEELGERGSERRRGGVKEGKGGTPQGARNVAFSYLTRQRGMIWDPSRRTYHFLFFLRNMIVVFIYGKNIMSRKVQIFLSQINIIH